MFKTIMTILLAAGAVLHAAAPKHGEKWVIGVSQCNLGEPWRVQMNADIKKAGDAQPQLQLVFKDAQNDTLKQRAQIEEFVNSEVDLLIVSPKEAAPLTPVVAQAFKRGIPVIVLDRRVLGANFTQFIGADNRRIGRSAGEWIVRRLADSPRVKAGGKARVVELKGLMTSTPGQERSAGFREAIQGQPVEIIFEAEMKWLEPEARKEMESALAVHQEIELVYAHNDPGAHGAYLAARAAGRQEDIAFVGIDGLPQEGRAYVQQGLLAASFEYPTGGTEAVENALKLLHGETVPKEITLPSRVFTKENIASGGEVLK
jgi:ribose transport system substrate-binding protein